MKKILLIDDDTMLSYSIKRTLESKYEVIEAENSGQAFKILNESDDFCLILLDLRLGKENGLNVLEKLSEMHPALPVVMLTAYGTSDVVLKAIKMGAKDFLVKPINYKELRESIEKYSVSGENSNGGNILLENDFSNISFVGISKGIREVLKIIANAAPTMSPVLITGETGTGKEHVAGLIHEHSGRKGRFVPINCAAIPRELLESELFGHKKGAYSGAVETKIGKFQLADGGTIFLDEIGELPSGLQAKLLRVLEDGKVEKLGSNESIHVDVRIIAATNRDLTALMDEGRFRADMFYRLNGLNIHIPPLRERKEDILPVASYFISNFAKEMNKTIKSIHPKALAKLQEHRWQGNIRELKNVVRKAVILTHGDFIAPDDIQFSYSAAAQQGTDDLGSLTEFFMSRFQDNVLIQSIELVEKCLIQETLKTTENQLAKTADKLGVSRVTLNAKIKKFRIIT